MSIEIQYTEGSPYADLLLFNSELIGYQSIVNASQTSEKYELRVDLDAEEPSAVKDLQAVAKELADAACAAHLAKHSNDDLSDLPRTSFFGIDKNGGNTVLIGKSTAPFELYKTGDEPLDRDKDRHIYAGAVVSAYIKLHAHVFTGSDNKLRLHIGAKPHTLRVEEFSARKADVSGLSRLNAAFKGKAPVDQQGTGGEF